MDSLTRVQKKKKNNKPSGFISFVKDFARKRRAEGRYFHGLKEEMDAASPFWKELTQEQKDSYNDLAKAREPKINIIRTTYTSFGESVQENEAKKKIEAEGYEAMLDEINLMIDESDESGNLDDLVFIFICTTAFFSNNEDIYPAELAMAKFSLKEGIIDDLHVQINPGVLPLGSSADALEKSEATHKYPLPPKAKGEKDYLEVLKSIVMFLHPMDKLPIIFGEGNTRDNKKPLEDTCRILDKIFYASGEDDVMKDLQIYPIDELFFILNKRTTANNNRFRDDKKEPLPSISYAASNLKSTVDIVFGFVSKACDFHASKEVFTHCCLSKVRSYGYSFAEWCSNFTKYLKKEGKHCPYGYS